VKMKRDGRRANCWQQLSDSNSSREENCQELCVCFRSSQEVNSRYIDATSRILQEKRENPHATEWNAEHPTWVLSFHDSSWS